MKKIYTSLFIVLLLWSVNLRGEDVSPVTTPENPVRRATDSVLSYFHQESGTVEAVTDGTAKVKFKGEAVIQKGMRFSVFRQGKPFYHPVTNALIGNLENFIGKVEATGEKSVDGLQTCSVVKGTVSAGDAVRMTASKIRLAFFQEKKSDWELSEAFYNSLKDSGRFEIVESYASSYLPEDVAKLARDLNADAFVIFSTPVKEEQRYAHIELYWAEDAKLFGAIEESAGQGSIAALAPEEKFITSALTEKEPWGTYQLPGGQLFAVGDVDGNGTDELVVSDGLKISLYSFKQELQEIWSIEDPIGGRYISLDVLDVNGNGRDEIFVTTLIEGSAFKSDESKMGKGKAGDASVRSFVVEFDDAEGYRKVRDDIPYFVRVSGNTLLMQRFGGSKSFSGPVYEGEWKDGGYQPGKQLALPHDVNIYGFTYIDWQNNGQTQILTFDDNGYLILYDLKGNALWKSGKSYGKFHLSFEKETYSLVNPTVKWAVRGRLVPVRTERGAEVIVVQKIPVLEKVPGIGTKGAEVYSLWWDGSEMDEKPVLAEVSGSITDYLVKGDKLFLVSRGSLFSFVKSAASGELSKGSVLYYYKLGMPEK